MVTWLLLLLLWLLGVRDGSQAFSPPEPAPPPTPIVLRSGGQTATATLRLAREGNVDFELDAGAPLDVAVRGSYASRRIVTFTAWACTAPGARVVLPPGRRALRIPRLRDGPYEITVRSGALTGIVIAAIANPNGQSAC